MNEKQFEDIIAKYPELIESGLSLLGRQVNVAGKFIDLLFEDRYGQKLILELKIGAIVRKHVGQIMDYEGRLLSEDDPTIRVMLVGNRVPPSLRKSLDHHGIEWKEIAFSRLKSFLEDNRDGELSVYIEEEQAIPPTTKESLPTTVEQKVALPEPIGPSNLSIADKMKYLFGKNYLNEVLTRSNIHKIYFTAFPGSNLTSIVPSDYCYNIVNQGIKFANHLFESLGGGRFKVLGDNYDYEGTISWKGKPVGKWEKGDSHPHFWEKIGK